MKVTYKRIDGGRSTAYLEDDPRDDGAHAGVDKYTDRPLACVWSDEANEWLEVAL